MYTEIKLYFVENPFLKKSILSFPEIYVRCHVFRLEVKLLLSLVSNTEHTDKFIITYDAIPSRLYTTSNIIKSIFSVMKFSLNRNY